MMMTAGMRVAQIFRMNILTGHSVDKTCHENASAAAAGMHTETYDTH